MSVYGRRGAVTGPGIMKVKSLVFTAGMAPQPAGAVVLRPPLLDMDMARP